MSAMFLSLPVKACLEEISFVCLCQKTLQGYGCACTGIKEKGCQHFTDDNFASKGSETDGGKQQFQTDSHAAAKAKVYII